MNAETVPRRTASNRIDTGTPEHSETTIVLGGGIAGLYAASQLADEGRRVLLIEADSQLGGMHRSVDIGDYSFDLGSIFYEDQARLFDLAPGLRDLCPVPDRVQRRVSADGQILHYPFDPKDALRWPLRVQLRCVCSLLYSRLLRRRDGSLEGICVSQLGKTLFEQSGLRNYTLHFNGLPPAEIDEEFYFSRMKFVHAATRLKPALRAIWRAVRRKPYRSKPKARMRIRPRTGYFEIFDRIALKLKGQGVTIHLENALQRIEQTDKGFAVTTSKGEYKADQVISALPLATLHEALFQQSAGLESLDLLTLFISADQLLPEAGNVVFNFHKKGGWKRLTVYSRLYPDILDKTGRECFSVEVTVPPGQAADPKAAFDAFSEHVTSIGFAGGLRLEGSFVSPSAYPVFRLGAPAKVAQIVSKIEATGVIPVGRQGRFEYLPTSSGVIRRVQETLAK